MTDAPSMSLSEATAILTEQWPSGWMLDHRIERTMKGDVTSNARIILGGTKAYAVFDTFFEVESATLEQAIDCATKWIEEQKANKKGRS